MALVRDYLDEADDLYPDGYEIGDFMILYEVFAREAESQTLEPWSGGVRSGFNSPLIAFSSTTSAYWLDEAWLSEALERVRERRREVRDDDSPSASDDD